MDKWSETALPDGNILVRNPRNGKQMMLPAEIINAMSYCNRFRTLDEHVDELMGDSGQEPERRKSIRSVIQSLHEGGMTISAQEICDRLAAPAGINHVDEKPILTVITWERPEPLVRLLDSIIRNCDPTGIERCIVIDDSRDAECIRQNREITAAANQRSGFVIEYFGSEEALELLEYLVAQLPEHEEAIRFLMDRERWAHLWTCGISRNYSQILTVGHPLIVFDDDVICDVHEAPVSEPGINLSDYPRQAMFFKDQGEWPPPAADGQRDPVARHMRCLGLTIPEALAVLGVDKPDPSTLHQGEAHFAGRFDQRSKVLVTECGSLGDTGTGSNKWLTRLSAESRGWLLQDEHTLPMALTMRNAWMGRKQFTFAPSSNMSQITGTDNRDFLPPYFPFNRVEDRLFGQSTSFLFPNSFTLDQPWVIPHCPIPERFWSEQDNDFTMTTSFPEDLIYIPERLFEECPHDDPRERLGALARHYLNLANCPEQKLIRLFTDDWNHKRAVKLLELAACVQDSADRTPAWQEYVHRAYQQVVDSQLEELTVEKLHSNSPRMTGEELLQFWRNSFQNFGQALLAWPAIREAARSRMP